MVLLALFVSPQAAASAVITAIIALIASWAVLGFLASLLLNVIDVLFVCTAMDRDARTVSKGAACLGKVFPSGPSIESRESGFVPTYDCVETCGGDAQP